MMTDVRSAGQHCNAFAKKRLTLHENARTLKIFQTTRPLVLVKIDILGSLVPYPVLLALVWNDGLPVILNNRRSFP